MKSNEILAERPCPNIQKLSRLENKQTLSGIIQQIQKLCHQVLTMCHDRNYQRSFPIMYNQTNSSAPIIAARNNSLYINPHVGIFMFVGTGGAHQYDFLGKSPYIVTQFKRFGFLKIDMLDNGTRMVRTFSDSREGNSCYWV